MIPDDWKHDGRTGEPVSPEDLAESERRVREAEAAGDDTPNWEPIA